MDIIEFLEKLNWQTLLGMILITWYFTQDIKKSLEKHESRIDKLYEMFYEVQKEIKQLHVDFISKEGK